MSIDIIRVLVPQDIRIIRILTGGPPGPPGPPGSQANLRGPFANGNIWLSEDGLLLLSPDSTGHNIAIGNGALAGSVSPNSVVAIGSSAGSIYGQLESVTEGITGTGTNWSGTDPYTHAPGSVAPLSFVIPGLDADTPYYVKYTIAGRTVGSVTVKTDGGGLVFTAPPSSANGDYVTLVRTKAGNTQVSFHPTTDFDGTLSNVVVESLGGRTSVFVGHLAGQYTGNAPSTTFVGAYCGQGQEYDPVTGGDIHGTNKLGGTNNSGYGEACLLHIIGGASSNCGYGFNSLFNLQDGSGNVAYGNASGQFGYSFDGNTLIGSSAYYRGIGSDNTFIGNQCGWGAFASTTTTADIVQGDTVIHVADASLFAVGGMPLQNTMFAPGTKVTAVDIGANTITVDKAVWNDRPSGTNIESVAAPHSGTEVVGIGYLALENISGASTQMLAVGSRAGRNLTTGSQNTLVGYRAGDTMTTGSACLMVGRAVNPSTPTASNEMNVGNAIFGRQINLLPGQRPFIGIDTQTPTSTLDVNGILTARGGMILNTRPVTASGLVIVLTSDRIIAIRKTVGAATAVSLFASPALGTMLTFKDAKGDAATNNITITPAGGGTIDGAPTLVINTNWGKASIVYDGVQWLTI